MLIERDAFLYLDPKGNKKSFAQCNTCVFNSNNRCAILDVKISSDISCGFYISGKSLSLTPKSFVTAEEAGLVDRQVRCENCRFFDKNVRCQLFSELTSEYPKIFYLDSVVDPYGCCNAQTPMTQIKKQEPSAGDVHVSSALGGSNKPDKKRNRPWRAFISGKGVKVIHSPDQELAGDKSVLNKVYNTTDDLPAAVKNKLKGKKLRQWMHIWNSEYKQHGDEGRAFASAWATVKKSDVLSCPPMVGVGGRTLEPFDDGTLFTPLKHDPAALQYLRQDQVPRFLDAVTHPKRLSKRQVAIKDLTAVKGRVARETVEKHLNDIKNVKPPVVVKMNGNLYVGDGHDRIAAQWLNGDNNTTVRYHNLDPYDERKPDPKTQHLGSKFDLLQGAKGRVLANYHDNTLAVPFHYDPAFFAHIRQDQLPKFLHAITHQKKSPIQEVPLAPLVAIQDRINADTVAGHVENPKDKPPVIVHMNGMDYIGDGHDRLTADWLRGKKTAKVHYKNLDGPVTNTMKRDEDIKMPFTISKIDKDKRQIFGWASVITKDGKPIIDKQGDVILCNELEPAAYDYVLNSRLMGDMHKDIGVGRMIESCVFTKEKQQALGVDLPTEAWWLGFIVDNNGVWKSIKQGERPEFSIGGFALSKDL